MAPKELTSLSGVSESLEWDLAQEDAQSIQDIAKAKARAAEEHILGHAVPFRLMRADDVHRETGVGSVEEDLLVVDKRQHYRADKLENVQRPGSNGEPRHGLGNIGI